MGASQSYPRLCARVGREGGVAQRPVMNCDFEISQSLFPIPVLWGLPFEQFGADSCIKINDRNLFQKR